MNDLAEFVAARLDEAEALAGKALIWQPLALRMVKAGRSIMSRHTPHQPAFGGPACNWCSEDVDDRPQIAKERWPCPDVLSLAAVWSDHPDYDQEWAP